MLIFMKFLVTFLVIVLLVILIRVTLYINRRFLAGFRKGLATEFFLQIRNESNFPGRFELYLEDPADELEIFVGSKRNKVETFTRPVSVMNYSVIEEQRTIAAAASPSSSGSSGSTKEKSGSGKKAGAAAEKAKAGLGIVPAIGGLISGVGSILPGRMGAPLRRVGSSMRRSTKRVTKVTKAPKRVMGKSKQLTAKSKAVQKKAGKAGIGGGDEKKKAGNGQEADKSDVVEYDNVEMEEGVTGYEYEEEFYDEKWYVTPVIETASSKTLSVSLLPDDPFETREYSFEIITQLTEENLGMFSRRQPEPKYEILYAVIIGHTKTFQFFAQGVTIITAILSLFASGLLVWQALLFWRF